MRDPNMKIPRKPGKTPHVQKGAAEKWTGKQKDKPESDAEKQKPFVNKSPSVGRNDPCPCGSGKKFKKCCDGK